MNLKKIIFLCFLVVLCGCATGPDRITTIEQYILKNERKIQLLESELQKDRNLSHTKEEDFRTSEKDLRTQFAEMRASLNALEKNIQRLDGSIEELKHTLEQKVSLQEDKRDMLGERVKLMKERVVHIEDYLNLEPLEVKKPGEGKKNLNSPSINELSEEQLYVQAKQSFDQEDLETARQLFEKFLQRYPKSDNADNSQFWIGEIYYREKWYEKAVLEYQKVIENYPYGNKVQAALLKQGLSFVNLGDNANSRLILTELVDKHPDSPEAEIAKAKLKELQ